MMRCVFMAGALLAFAAAAQAETLPLTGFNSVSAAGRISVEVRQGPTHAVEVTGPRAADVIARVRGDELVLDTPRHWFGRFGRGDAHVRVTLPNVRALSSAAGADLTASDIRAETLSLHASSGADLTVTGTCGTVLADASSGSDLRAGGLRCRTANVDASSGADAVVYASETANVDASSGSDVRVSGGARIGNLDLSSGADLHR